MRYFFTICLLIAIPQSLCAQAAITGQLSYGSFVSHSENSAPAALDETFDILSGAGLDVSIPLKKNLYLISSLSWEEAQIIFNSKVYNTEGEFIRNEQWGTLTETYYPLELGLMTGTRPYSGMAGGVIIINTVHAFMVDNRFGSFEDIFNSTGMGAFISGTMGKQITAKFYIQLQLKLRYQRALIFRGEGRDFSNYSHENSSVNLSLGLGRII